MKQNLQNMTRGPLGKQIIAFSIPLVLSNLLQVLFNMSDIAVVGRYAGPIPLGAVGSTTTVVALFTGFLIGLGGAVNILVARYFGSRDNKQLGDTIHTAAIICLIAGIVIMVAGQICSRGILVLLKTKNELVDLAELYLKIYFLGMPALAVYNFGNAVFSAIGDTKKPLLYLALAGVINVVLNLYFVIVWHLDAAGVAIASVISQYVSAVLIVVSLARAKGDYALSLRKLRITGDKAKDILVLGIPAGLQGSIFHISNMFIQLGVNTFDATMVAGNSAAANADNIVYTVMSAFYTACSSFMSQNYGAGRPVRMMQCYRVSLAYSFAAGAVLGIALVIFAPQFLSLFSPDPEVINAGMSRMMIMGLSYAFSAFMDCTISAARSLGESFVPTIIVIVGVCVFRVVWIYTVFAYFGTISSLYTLYIFSWFITAAAEILYFKSVVHKKLPKISLWHKKPLHGHAV